jgi:hypothetical protein
VLLSKNPKRRVPKEFLQPRPMSSPARQQNMLSRALRVPAFAVVFGVLTAALLWWSPLNGLWMNWAVSLTADNRPSMRSAELTVSPTTVTDGRCAEAIVGALTAADARVGLMLDPIARLCPIDGVPELDSEVAPPIEAVPARLFIGTASHVRALDPNATTPLLRTLGLHTSGLLRPRAPHAIASTALERLSAGDVDASLLAGRIVFVTLGAGGTEREPAVAAQMAALSSGLELEPIEPLDVQWLLALAAALCAAVIGLRRFEPRRRLARYGTLFAIGVVFTGGAGFLYTRGVVVQLPALAAALLVCSTLLDWPRRMAERKADKSASALLKKASRLLEMRAPEYLDDAEFWQSLARKASQAHPADDILMAELPPFSWRLKFWPNGDVDESIIKERRRDIRRTPYSNLQGVPVASVTDNYLMMKGVPAVLVPILHSGEVEGYLMMVGQSAAEYFVDHPMVSQELAQELASLIKHRRTLQQEGAGGQSSRNSSAGAAEQMLSAARAALTELQLMTALVQNSPVGLCYADPFGDVRIMGKAWLKWLPRLGLEVPVLLTQNTLKPRQLPLRELMQSLMRQMGRAAPLLSGIGNNGFTVDIPLGRAEAPEVRSLRLRVVPLGDANDENSVRGFLASLTELSQATSSTSSSTQMQAVVQLGGDPLVVFSLARLLQRVVSTLSGSVKLQTPREPAHVVGHRMELKEALEGFLVSAAAESAKGGGPVVSVKEHQDRIEVRILDLKLGVPSAALQRAVLAPSAPPPGLNHLGALIRAVENSHGHAELRTDGSWGVELELSLVRARPRMESAEAVLANLKGSHRPVRV